MTTFTKAATTALFATTVAASLVGGAVTPASAENTIRQQQTKLDRVFAQQRAERDRTRQVDAIVERERSVFSNPFSNFNFRAVKPLRIERGGGDFGFTAGERGR